MNKLKKDEIEELRGVLENAPKTTIKEATIVYDGQQYSIRIPLKMARSLELDIKKDKVVFELISPQRIGDRPQLNIRLVRE